MLSPKAQRNNYLCQAYDRPTIIKLYMGWGTTYSLLQISLCDVGDSKVWKTAHHLLCDVTSHDFLIIQKEIGLLCV